MFARKTVSQIVVPLQKMTEELAEAVIYHDELHVAARDAMTLHAKERDRAKQLSDNLRSLLGSVQKNA